MHIMQYMHDIHYPGEGDGRICCLPEGGAPDVLGAAGRSAFCSTFCSVVLSAVSCAVRLHDFLRGGGEGGPRACGLTLGAGCATFLAAVAPPPAPPSVRLAR
jgi:hypothetical protein